jgi:MOSC domain-containing protein YiiM
MPATLDETVVRLGDRLRIGEVLLEVTQPRSPCWKLDELGREKFGLEKFLQRYAASGRVGYYLRVLEPGILQRGMPIEHIPTDCPAPGIHDLFLAKHHGGRTTEERAIIEQALAHPALSDAWRTALHALLTP